MLEGLLESLGAAFGGATAGRKQTFQNEMDLAQFALNQAATGAQIQQAGAQTGLLGAQTGLAGAQTTEVTERLGLEKTAAARNQLVDQATVMASQIGELRNGIAAGMIDPNDPRVKANADAIWAAYVPVLKQLVPGYNPPNDMWIIKRTLKPDEIAALQPLLARIDTSDPNQAKTLANALGVDPATITAIGKQAQGLTAPEAATMGVRREEIASTEATSRANIASDVMVRLSQISGFTSLDKKNQQATMAAMLIPSLGEAEGNLVASKMPQINYPVSPDVAAQVSANIYATNVGLKETTMRVKSEEGMAARREAGETKRSAAQNAAAIKVAEIGAASRETVAETRGAGAGGAAKEPTLLQARDNMIKGMNMLNDPVDFANMDKTTKVNLYNKIADNMSIISGSVGAYRIPPETLAIFIESDPKPAKRAESWKAWRNIEQGMQTVGYPIEYQQWFYNERYRGIFGDKKFKAQVKSKTTSKPKSGFAFPKTQHVFSLPKDKSKK